MHVIDTSRDLCTSRVPCSFPADFQYSGDIVEDRFLGKVRRIMSSIDYQHTVELSSESCNDTFGETDMTDMSIMLYARGGITPFGTLVLSDKTKVREALSPCLGSTEENGPLAVPQWWGTRPRHLGPSLVKINGGFKSNRW